MMRHADGDSARQCRRGQRPDKVRVYVRAFRLRSRRWFHQSLRRRRRRICFHGGTFCVCWSSYGMSISSTLFTAWDSVLCTVSMSSTVWMAISNVAAREHVERVEERYLLVIKIGQSFSTAIDTLVLILSLSYRWSPLACRMCRRCGCCIPGDVANLQLSLRLRNVKHDEWPFPFHQPGLKLLHLALLPQESFQAFAWWYGFQQHFEDDG
jgi:hypothetical protein